MYRRLGVTLLLGIVFVGVVVVAHDMFVKKEYLQNMELIGRQITEYRGTHEQKWPSRDEFLQFEINDRNMNIEKVHYYSDKIAPDAPGDTIIAYTQLSRFRILGNGHAALHLDGQVDWVGAEDL